MRWVLWALVVVALVGNTALAAEPDPTNLTGGVFIFHHDTEIVYSAPLEGWCQHYLDGYAIASCEEQNPSIMTTDESIWYLISAFDENKIWCGTEFGFGDYDPYLVVFTGQGPCTPGGNLEIPTEGWPGPNAGTAIVTTDMAWEGNFQPVYYFTSYAYTGYPAQIPLDADPIEEPFVGWGNCEMPPVPYPATACLPSMGIMMEGVECCPQVEPEGACCFAWGDSCLVMTESACTNAGGEYQGDDATCDPNPCPELWACCVEYEVCVMMTEADCLAASGDWRGVGAVCIANGGDVSCTTPVEPTSWGKIKAIYR